MAVMSLWRNFSLGPSCRDQNEAVIALWPERPPEKSVNNLPLSSSIWGLIVFLLITKTINLAAASLVGCFFFLFFLIQEMLLR